MSEKNRSAGGTAYLEVKKSQLQPKSLKNPYETFLSRTRNDTPQELHEKSLLVTRLLAELHQVKPNQRVNSAVQFGIAMILSALDGQSFVPNANNMKVVFLSPESFKNLKMGKTSGGVMIPGIDIVFVQLDPQDTDFITASNAFHELVHSWIDKQVHALHSEVNETDDSRKTFIEVRRVGLMVRHLLRDSLTGEINDSEFLGELVNELGNFAWQSIFLERIQNDKEMRTLFADEFTLREAKLLEMFGDPKAGSITVGITDENNKETTVSLDSKNLFWNKMGKIEVSSTTLIMQLVDDLSFIVGDVGQLNFRQALVSLKTRPEQQSYLRNALDSKLGQGFYSKLRRANYHTLSSLLSLLSEVQTHLL